jgi:hypothetical protein
MTSIAISVGFGLVVIAMAFKMFIFYRAFCDEEKRSDHRYRLVAGALSFGSLGVAMWAFNPLLQSFGGPPLPAWGMFVSSALILLSAILLVSSTAMGGSKRTLRVFLATCILWTTGCTIWGIAQ